MIDRPGALPLLVCMLALAACSSGLKRVDEARDYQSYAGQPVEDFWITRLTGWTPVSRNRLVVWNGANDAYLVTVWRTCNRLDFADVVAITDTANRVSRFEKVVVDGQTCPIESIQPVDVRAMHEDRADRSRVPAAG